MFPKVVVLALIGAAFAHYIPAHDHVHASHPYAFGYSIKDHHGEQHREESGTGGQAVKGSYGFTDARGVHRQVNYVADHGGFRAEVKTNEQGTANQNPAAVHISSSAPAAHAEGFLGAGPIAPALGGLGYAGVAPGLYGEIGVNTGLGYAGYGAAPFAGYAGPYAGYGGYGLGLASGLLGSLPYARYGY